MATFFRLTIDCLRPERLVGFWQPLLGYDVPVPPEGECGVRIWFQQVPETKSVKNRLHLDLRLSRGPEASRAERRADLEVAVAAVETRDGSLLRWTESEEADRVSALMADLGNEFCLV